MPSLPVRGAISLLLAAWLGLGPAIPSAAAELPYFRFRGGADARIAPAVIPDTPVTPEDPAFTADAEIPTPGRVNALFHGVLTASQPASFATAAGSQSIPGIELTSDGKLLGKPTTAGTFKVAYLARSAGGATRQIGPLNATILDIGGAVTPKAFADLPAGQVGVAYPGKVWAANVDSASFVVTGGGVPGLTLLADGSFSGAPTTSGSFPITVSLTDPSGGPSASVSGTVAVAVPAKSYQATATLPAGQVGKPYAGKVEAPAGSTFVVASGGIPGVTLRPDGSYEGIPSEAGTFAVSFTATSPAGGSDTTPPVNVLVSPPGPVLPLTLTANIPPNAQMNRQLVGGLTSTGVSQPTYDYADGSARIPGVIVEGNQLVGVPGQVGEYDLTFKVTAPDGRTATSQPSHVRVDSLGALTITDASAPYIGRAGDVWEDYTYRLDYDDRQFMHPGVFSVVSGALPNGLTLDEYGSFHGSPTKAGNFPIRYQVRMPDGRTALTDEKTIAIRPAENTELGVYATLPERLAVGQKFSEWDPFRVLLDDASKNNADGNGLMPFATTVTGELPTGVTLNGNGLFDGTPSKPGTYTATFTARIRDGSGEGVSRTYTYVVDETAFRIVPNKTRATALVYPGDQTYQWQYVDFGLNIEGGKGPFTLTAETVGGGPPLNHADPANPALSNYNDREWDFFYTQREVNQRNFRICATDAGNNNQRTCTIDLYMRWGADRPFTWTVAMENPSPSCVNGEVPYSYIVSVDPSYGTYTLNSVLTIDGRQGEDVSRRRIEPLGGGRYRVSAVMTRIGTSPKAYDILSVTSEEGVKLYPETDDATPVFYPQFGGCDREAMIGGPMYAGWSNNQNVYDAKDFAKTGEIVQSYVHNFYGNVILIEAPSRMQGSCFVFEHEVPDANGDKPPYQLDRNVFLSDDSCKGGPPVSEVTFSFMDSLGRTATTPTLYLGGW